MRHVPPTVLWHGELEFTHSANNVVVNIFAKDNGISIADCWTRDSAAYRATASMGTSVNADTSIIFSIGKAFSH